MSREEYLSELYGRLRQHKSGGELESVMKYYEEYFNEAGPEREAEIIAELGTPEQLTRQILGEQPGAGQAEYRYEEPRRRRWTTGKIVLLICLFPVWLSLLVGLGAGAVGLVAGIGGGGAVCVVTGIFLAWCGVTALFTPGFTTMLVFVGAGLAVVGFGLIMLVAAVALAKVIFKGFAALCRWIFVGGRRGVAV